MKLTRSIDLLIAKEKLKNVRVDKPLDYQKWLDFIASKGDLFIWSEDTSGGTSLLNSIEEIPLDHRDNVLSSLNKRICYIGHKPGKKIYDIAVSFHDTLNWIAFDFMRKPTKADIQLFFEMANYLDALFLINGKTKVTKEMVEALEG